MIKYLQIILISLLLTVALVQGETLDSELVRKAGETWLLADDTIFKAIRKKYHLVQNSDLFFPIQNKNGKIDISWEIIYPQNDLLKMQYNCRDLFEKYICKDLNQWNILTKIW